MVWQAWRAWVGGCGDCGSGAESCGTHRVCVGRVEPCGTHKVWGGRVERCDSHRVWGEELNNVRPTECEGVESCGPYRGHPHEDALLAHVWSAGVERRCGVWH
eukprot:353885-Chlamydomonas_euryale.AAC.1